MIADEKIISINTQNDNSIGCVYEKYVLSCICNVNETNNWKRCNNNGYHKWVEDEYLFIETQDDTKGGMKLFHKIVTIAGNCVIQDKFEIDKEYTQTIISKLLDKINYNDQIDINALEKLKKNPHPNLVTMIGMNRFFMYDKCKAQIYLFTHLSLPYYGKDMSQIDLSMIKTNICMEIAERLYVGLIHLHDKVHIAHLDIKPGNICLSDIGHSPTIIDYGSCLFLDDNNTKNNFKTIYGTQIRNTFGYFSPSQFVAFLFGTESEGDTCSSDLKMMIGDTLSQIRDKIWKIIINKYGSIFTLSQYNFKETRESAEENDMFCLSLCVFELLSGGFHFFTKEKKFRHNKKDLRSVVSNYLCYFEDPVLYLETMCEKYIRNYEDIKHTSVVKTMRKGLSILVKEQDKDILDIVGDEWFSN